ncbi:MAG: prepilin-type N-terminal cleavage/methylation domain-containing protein [Rubrivivax sp.]|nr:prepilin-type N-terminal cleavage/methylation domain-containing protein [Rubrivivax sp.]
MMCTRKRGVSLIEALVAMAVMAFGMLGVVGLQGTLRGNADLSKQRSEATRIAQEEVEKFRIFGDLAAFDAKAGFGATNVVGYTTNTTYAVTGTLTPAGVASDKTLVIDVAWSDRKGEPQNVRLVSSMARIAPELAASLVAPPAGSGGVQNPEGRSRGIPPQAKNFGDGTTGFVPPGGTGAAWLFNNTTGVVTAVCATTVTDNSVLQFTDLVSCVGTQQYQLIWGFIRFDLTNPPTTASVHNPNSDVPGTVEAEVVQTAPAVLTGTRSCLHGYADANLNPVSPFKLAVFFCLVPVNSLSTPQFAWSGTLQMRGAPYMPVATPFSASGAYLSDAATANRKVCRIRAPATYTSVNTPLGNQNMIVIRAGDGITPHTCPAPTTFGHQPAP